MSDEIVFQIIRKNGELFRNHDVYEKCILRVY